MACLFCIWDLVVEMFLVDNWILKISLLSQADGIFVESSDIFWDSPSFCLSCGFIEALKNIYYAVIHASLQTCIHHVHRWDLPRRVCIMSQLLVPYLVVGDHEAERLLHSKCKMRLEAGHQSHHVLSKGKRCYWGCSSQVPVPSDKAMLFPRAG